jgi:hypothetical protein
LVPNRSNDRESKKEAFLIWEGLSICGSDSVQTHCPLPEQNRVFAAFLSFCFVALTLPVPSVACHAVAQSVGGSVVLKFSAFFPRNEPQNSTEYLSERPEMASHNEESRKAKTRKGKNTYENKTS